MVTEMVQVVQLFIIVFFLLTEPSDLGVLAAINSTSGRISLGLPLDCKPEITCWIGNYMDDDPGAGAVDYNCGHRTYNGHKGTDFAILDRRVMDEGVTVTAAASGTVARLRDGMADIAVTKATRAAVAGRECGNGVVLQNGSGWETQYCHMRRRSIVVRVGQRVAAGQKLGLVGLSGMTQFPHVHLSVRHDGEPVDPFVGLSRTRRCGLGNHPLWRSDLIRALAYEPFAIYHAGFAGRLANPGSVRAGDFDGGTISTAAPMITLWADIFGVAQNDVVTLRIRGPSGATLAERRHVLNKPQALLFEEIGRRRSGREWPAGEYVGEISVLRRSASGGETRKQRVVRTVEVR
jgi:murein DD-endopeptidase MepM/ murein hydrolase activator NlpD